MNSFRERNYQFAPPVTQNLIIIDAIFLFATYVLEARFNIDLNDTIGLHYYARVDLAHVLAVVGSLPARRGVVADDQGQGGGEVIGRAVLQLAEGRIRIEHQ